jgi:hypothetical protein
VSIPTIPKHRNIAEWALGQTRDVVLDSWEPELQPLNLVRSGDTMPISVVALRVYLSEMDGVKGPFEWNIVSKRLMATIKTILESGQWKDVHFKVTRRGAPPNTVWEVSKI